MTTEQTPFIQGFRSALTPITPLERLTYHIEAAMDCARDESKSEAERVKELRLRIELMQLDADSKQDLAEPISAPS